MTKPAELADKIRTHFRPLTIAQQLFVAHLAVCDHWHDRENVAGTLDMSAREIIFELLKILPAPVTEEQRWTAAAMQDVTK